MRNNNKLKVLDIWKGDIENCIGRKPVILEKGMSLYHGARRYDGELKDRKGWLWEHHWYTLETEYAERYAVKGNTRCVDFAFITLKPTKDLKLLDMTEVDFLKLCEKAEPIYSHTLMGCGDNPIRHYMSPTLKHYCGDDYHGYTNGDKELFIFDFKDNLKIVDIDIRDGKRR